MRRVLAILTLMSLSLVAIAQEKELKDSLKVQSDTILNTPVAAPMKPVLPPLPELTNEYLDTVNLKKKVKINDYMTLGALYGVTLSQQWFNPSYSQEMLFNPVYASILFTMYGKMFGYLPYFGFETGVEYMHSGFRMKSKDDEPAYYYIGTPSGAIGGVQEELITVFRVPFRAKFHFEAGPMRFLINLGIYGGYRSDIVREGYNLEEIKYSFLDTDNRFDYGMEGGIGFGVVLDPVEFYVNGLVGWSWMSLFQPNTTPSKYNNYYYRYAYPIDIAITFGVHFQLSKRTGKTIADLKREAKRSVYEDSQSQHQQ